ncbi:hypothetical protein GCM10010531_38810 [Blastococcus jejuensis]|uniref:Uncharacterized protein n=1 Tax=Blastococcus jejuensis TaxID=351224 RepID=A0ABP6PQB6_9ACTN
MTSSSTRPYRVGDWSEPLRRSSPVALILFLGIVAGLLARHLWSGASGTPAAAEWLATSEWSVERDRGIPELYGYALLTIGIVGLVVLGRRRSRPVLHAWAATFALILLDDQMMVHERGGRILVRLLGSPTEILGVRAQDVGELAVWAVLALLPLLAVVVLHRLSDGPTRRLSAALGVLLGALVLFGIVFDQLHSMFLDGLPVAGPVAGAFEDGGELAVMAVLAAFVIGLLRERVEPAPIKVLEQPDRLDLKV